MTLGLFDPAFLAVAGAVAAGGYDADAQAYITAVEAADGQALETGVRDAINAFVVGCKDDGIWNAIKASCILAGARTLNGALVPLVGTAPTNFNFVSGDYNRKTGLVGNGSTKYLDSNRNNNADPQNSNHNAVWLSTQSGQSQHLLSTGISAGSNSLFRNNTGDLTVRSRPSDSTVIVVTGAGSSIGLIGHSRISASSFIFRHSGSSSTSTSASTTPANQSIFVFSRDSGAGANSARIAFYSIGEFLDLALLDARVTALINAFGAAIP